MTDPTPVSWYEQLKFMKDELGTMRRLRARTQHTRWVSTYDAVIATLSAHEALLGRVELLAEELKTAREERDSIRNALAESEPALEAGARGCVLIRNYRADLIGSLSPTLLKEMAGEEFEYTDHSATLRALAVMAAVIKTKG